MCIASVPGKLLECQGAAAISIAGELATCTKGHFVSRQGNISSAGNISQVQSFGHYINLRALGGQGALDFVIGSVQIVDASCIAVVAQG